MADTTQHGRVVVIGSINVDLFARVDRHPRPGETLLGRDGSRRAGGKGANQAVAAALAGAATSMVGCVGDDGQSVATSLLEKAGVDLTRVRTVRGTPTGVALITVSDTGENSIIVIPGANAEVSVADVHAAGITPADVVVVQGEIPVEVVDEVAFVCAQRGARLVVNLAPVVALSPATLLKADPLVVNEHEARAAERILTSHDARAGAEVTESDDMDTEEAAGLAERIRAAGVASVVVTLGSAGAVVASAAGATVVEGERVTEVVDTTGAGDCFVGTLAARLVAGDDLATAARAGNAAAADAVQKPGAQESYAWR